MGIIVFIGDIGNNMDSAFEFRVDLGDPLFAEKPCGQLTVCSGLVCSQTLSMMRPKATGKAREARAVAMTLSGLIRLLCSGR